MWFWQRKSVRKRYALWAKLLSVSAGAHAVFLLCMFFVYHGDTVDLFLEINTRNREGAPVVFRTFTSRPQRQIIKKTPAKKVVQVPLKKITQPKKAVQKKPAPPKPKLVPKTTVAQKEPVKKIQPKKEEPKVVQKKQVEQKQEQKAAPVPEKKVAQAPKPKQSSVKEEKKVAQPQEVAEQLEVSVTEQADVAVVPAYMLALQQEITQQFKPPIGVAPDAQCQVKMVIGWDGAMHEVNIEQSSGILMYDVAARSAMHKLTLPRWTWGKSLTIVFKQ